MAGAFSQIGLEVVIRGMGDFNRGTSTLRKQMGLTGSALNRATQQSQGLGSSLAQTGGSIRNFGNQALILGFQLTFLASGAMVSVINAAAQFEKEMVKINTLVGVSQKQVGEWSDQLLDLAPKLGQTPKDLAEGLFFITSAGVRDATTAMDVLEISAKAAAIGMGSVKDVANAVTSIMQAYASSGITAAEATDILTATVREGKTQAEELAPSIGRVIPLASQMGISFEEVGAFIATFTRLGVPAAVAVTSLRSALTAILKPTSSAGEALAKYGFSMDNVRTSIDEAGLAQTLIKLATILEQDNEAFGDIIGSARGLTGVLAVTGDLSESYIKILNELENSAGITADGFETVSKTTAFMAQQAKASALVVATSFGQILLPGINQVLEAVTKLFGAFARFGEANPGLIKLIGVMAGLVTVAGPLLIVFGLVISSVGTLIGAVGALGTAFSALLAWPLLLVGAFALLATAIGGSLVAGFLHAQDAGQVRADILAIRAFKWGEGVILAFAQGMAAAAVAVLNVLIELGNAVAFWLQALSPPRLLPDIDKWGTATIQAWLDGFLKADFAVFNTISNTLEGFIRSLGLDDLKVVPEIRNMRIELLDLIHVFEETGKVSGKALGDLTKSIGNNSGVIKEYVKTFLELELATRAVTQAQEELNEVNRKFDEIIKPLKDELKDIDDIRQDELDKLRKEELMAMIKDPRAPQRVKELAQLELRQIALKKQVRTAEDQRDIELDAANLKLKAAELEQKMLDTKFKRLEALLAAQTKENQLIKEQIDLIESLNEKLKETAGDADFGAGGLGIPTDDDGGIGAALQGRIDRFFENEKFARGLMDTEFTPTILERIDQLIRDVKPKLAEIFKPTQEQLKELGKAWAPLIGFILDGVFPDDLSNVDPADRKFFTNYVQATIDELDEDSTVAGRFATVLSSIIAEGIKMAVGGMWGQVTNAFATELGTGEEDAGFLHQFLFGSGAGPIAFDFGSFFADMKTTLEETPLPDIKIFSQESIDNFNGFQDKFNAFFTAEGIKTAIEGAFSEENKNAVIGFFTGLSPSIGSVTDLVGLLIGGEGEGGGGSGGFNTLSSTMTLVGGVMDLFSSVNMQGLITKITEAKDYLTDHFIPEIGTKLESKLQILKTTITDVAGKIKDWFHARLKDVHDFIRDEVIVRIQELIDILFGDDESLGKTIQGLVTEVLEPFEESWKGIQSAVENVITKLKEAWTWFQKPWKVPDAVAQDSPSEFENAFNDAALSVSNLTNSLSLLDAINIGSSARQGMMNASNMTNLPVNPGVTNNTTSSVNFGGQTINNGMDAAEFMMFTQQVIRNEL